MNVPRDYQVELDRLNRRGVVVLLTDVTAWTAAVWCMARNEIIGASVALTITAVASSVGLGIFRRAEHVIDEIDRVTR